LMLVNKGLASLGVNRTSENIPLKQESEQVACSADKPITRVLDKKQHHQQNEIVSTYYASQSLPDVGIQFDVTVTQVDRPNLVYIQRYPPSFDGDVMLVDDSADITAQNAYKELILLEEISFNINSVEFFEHKENIVSDQVKKDYACIGRFSSDGQYYRALVTSVNREEGTADLVYVDYGTKETVPIESLKQISQVQISLPMQSTIVEIAGLKPKVGLPGERLPDSDWNVDSMKCFFNIVADKRLIVEIVDKNCSPIKINLYDRCFIEDTGLTKDVSVASIMRNHGFA